MFISDREMLDIPATEEGGGSQLVENPLVSVILITYNHDEFIAEAIEPVLRQKTDFPFEILIGEDQSTDHTLKICRIYQKKDPYRIRLISAETNVGMHRNISRLWCRCRGAYIAFCEGDDYWSDDRKLAKQVDFLNKNTNFSMCGAFTERIERGQGKEWRSAGQQGPSRILDAYGVEDLIPEYNFHFSSILLRKALIRFPSWFWRVYCADRPLYLLCAEKGPVGFIPEYLSVYRLHEGGIWSARRQMDKAQKGIELFEHIDEYFDYRYHRLIKKTVSQIIWSYAAECLLSGDSKTGRKLFRLSMAQALPALPAAPEEFIKVLIRLYFPYFYNLMKLKF
ncbi:MAG: glycosyltransferase [Desulfobacterales bacterium]|jgi:glycosyltransferase involved in cell wall biosynthesis|nr:glycosyltransferase [Desulfobacterales bacterium]